MDSRIGQQRFGTNVNGKELLQTEEDIKWLYDVHKVSLKGQGKRIRSAILIGSDDSPSEIWVSTLKYPMMNTMFTRVA